MRHRSGAQSERRSRPDGPLRVIVGRERFSEQHGWPEMPRLWPAGLASLVTVEAVPHGRLEERLTGGAPPADVVVDNIDLAAAAEGVWVANMPGLNAVPVAEHAIALLLALVRRLAETPLGFQPGRWGEPAGRSLAGTTACVIGTGAIGVQIAYRLTAFGVTVTGVCRRDREVPPFTRVFPAGHLKTAVADADAVIIAASHQAGSPPVIDDAVLRAMRPGALLVNVARGALLDTDAALAHLRAGRLGGLGLTAEKKCRRPGFDVLTAWAFVFGLGYRALGQRRTVKWFLPPSR